MVSLIDVIEPLTFVNPTVLLYVGGISREYREAATALWRLRHDAFCRGDFVRGKAFTRPPAPMTGKRKRCQECGEALALPWPFDPALQVCNRCTKRVSNFRLISATNASNRFRLDVSELWRIDQYHSSRIHVIDGDPFLSGRVMFRKDDVLLLATDKFG
jgi:hypothetical protein